MQPWLSHTSADRSSACDRGLMPWYSDTDYSLMAADFFVMARIAQFERSCIDIRYKPACGVYQMGEDQPRCCSVAGISFGKGKPFWIASNVDQRGVGISR